MLINRDTFRRLIGYLKGNSDLYHPGNHGHRGHPHNQLLHMYRNNYKTTPTAGTYSGQYTKMFNITIPKTSNQVYYLYRIGIYPDVIGSLEAFELLVFIQENSGTTILAYLQNTLTGKAYRLSNLDVYYVVNTDTTTLNVDFFLNPQSSWSSFSFEVIKTINSVGTWAVSNIMDRSALDAITLYNLQPFVSSLAGKIAVQKCMGYSPPASGNHELFEYMQNVATPAIGSPLGWLCITAGTPGTWIPVGQMGAAKNTTANRPTGVNRWQGCMYLDTTLSANGKPIWFNGSVWVDSTGASV